MILINNYMSRRDTRMPWILPYVDRAKVSRKYRDTVKQINNCRLAGEWEFVKMLSASCGEFGGAPKDTRNSCKNFILMYNEHYDQYRRYK